MSDNECDLGQKQVRAAGQPPSNTPSFGYSHIEPTLYRAISTTAPIGGFLYKSSR